MAWRGVYDRVPEMTSTGGFPFISVGNSPLRWSQPRIPLVSKADLKSSQPDLTLVIASASIINIPLLLVATF